MEKLIVVKYIECNVWRQKVWRRYKCIPYTTEDHKRVEKYVEDLNNATKNVYIVNFKVLTGVTKNKFLVKFKIINGFEHVEKHLTKIKSKVKYPQCAYKPAYTVKMYQRGELLPHENDLYNGKRPLIYLLFGEHDEIYEAEMGDEI